MARIAIVGGGPAGITTAIQLFRCGHEPVIFEKNKLGGTLREARRIENYPGHPQIVSGEKLASEFEKRVREMKLHVRKKEVASITRKKGKFELLTGKKAEEFDCVVICTGTVPKKAGFPGETKLKNAGLLFYGISGIGQLDKIKSTCVVGGGEAALDYALNLADRRIKVTIIHRTEPRGIKSLLDEARKEKKISWLKGKVLKGEIKNSKLVVFLTSAEKQFDIVLVAVGREMRLPKLTGIDPEKNVPGFKIAGDARRGKLGQVAFAVADGLTAALELDARLGGKK
jgi:thioredoxin reductase (NADPH)